MVPDDGCELVRGLIAAWGQVEVHYDGFRAQYAKPVAIAIPQGKRDAAIARAVAAEYHLPTVPESELERVAGEFGSVVPEDLRPPKPAPPKGDFFALSQAMMQFTHSLQAMPPIIISTAEGLDPAKLQGPTPGDVIAEIRAKRPGYDPRRWIPKRKGGRR
jgi:hypothetical protein